MNNHVTERYGAPELRGAYPTYLVAALMCSIGTILLVTTAVWSIEPRWVHNRGIRRSHGCGLRTIYYEPDTRTWTPSTHGRSPRIISPAAIGIPVAVRDSCLCETDGTLAAAFGKRVADSLPYNSAEVLSESQRRTLERRIRRALPGIRATALLHLYVDRSGNVRRSCLVGVNAPATEATILKVVKQHRFEASRTASEIRKLEFTLRID